MKVLALDQALGTTGWALFENGSLIECGKFDIKKTLPIEVRLHQIQKQVLDIITDKCGDSFPDLIAFEDIQNQRNNQTYCRLAYVQAAIMLLCYDLEIKFTILPPSHWRSVLGGSWGKKREEQKEKAIEYVRTHCQIEVDSDTADAICIGFAAIKEKKSNTSAF